MQFSVRAIYPILKKCFGMFWLFLILMQACTEKRDPLLNTVVVHFPHEPSTLHIVNGVDGAYRYVQEYAQKTLTRIDLRTQKQIPLLVKDLAQISANGLEYTYELRDDVKWDDGSPLTVDDVIFTIKVNKCPLTANETQRSTFDIIKDIQKDPSDSLKFKLTAKNQHYKNPYIFDEVFLLQKRSWDSASIFDQIAIWEMDDEKFQPSKYKGLEAWETEFNKGETGRNVNKLNGLGAYKITDWQTGSSITLVRKENWWGKNDTSVYSKAYPDKIIFKFFTDDAAVYLGLKKQSIDVSTTISNSSFIKLRETEEFNKNYHSGYTGQFNYNFIGMNLKPDGKKHKPFFTDKRVRKAMAYLTPVDELIKTIAKGSGVRQASFVQPAYKEYYNDTLKLIPYDTEKASQLLKEAGWIDTDKNGIRDKMINGKKVQFSFQYTYMASPQTKEAVLMLKEAYYKAGIDLQPNPVDGAVIIQNITNHDFDMAVMAWSGGAVPEDPEQIFHTRNWANNGYNFVGFGNAETDKMIDETSKETNPAKRMEMLKKLQAVIYDEAPYIFTYSTMRKIAIHKRFDNAEMYVERPGVILNNLKLNDNYKSLANRTE